jgi:hypothetical protein
VARVAARVRGSLGLEDAPEPTGPALWEREDRAALAAAREAGAPALLALAGDLLARGAESGR